MFHPETAEYTFSSAHRTFHRIDTIVAHRTNPNKVKKIKNTPYIFSDHNTIKLEVNQTKNKTNKPPKTQTTTTTNNKKQENTQIYAGQRTCC